MEDDDFAAAFADLNGVPAPDAAPPAADPKADTPELEAQTPDGETAPEPAATDPAPTNTAPDAETPPAEAPPPAPAPAPDPVAVKLAALEAELAALRASQAAEPAPAPAPAPEPEAPLYTADEQETLNKYFEEWPDVARGESLQRRAEYQHLVRYVTDQLVRPLAEQLAELQAYYEQASSSSQYSEIKALVPDYDQVRDATLAWIDTQPAYLKAAYQQVANEGSAQDVADLISRFKRETSYNAPATAPAPAPVPAPAAAPAPAPAALPPTAAAAVKSLKPVDAARGDTSAAPDPNNFEDAFKEFASKG